MTGNSRENYEHLLQSETVRYYLERGVNGDYLRDITALDRGIRDLHNRCRKAERSAQTYMAEAVYYRRKFEALETLRKEDEENRFPLFQSHDGGNEDEHQEA